ncbi:acyl transferase/acyl hydrolase/lysophospholipase, partial [Mycena epipterygia]
DGGGAGALSELLILERMMHRAKTEGRLDTVPSPCECFDIIGGSGMGGIVALMLGRLRMSVAATISAYETIRPQPGMQASKFEEALKNIFQLQEMRDAGADACKTLVCAAKGGVPDVFRSYDTPDEPANDCTIWEAARATSATPGLPEIGSKEMNQWHVGSNNPTSLLLEEAKKMYPSRPVVLVASIGTGHPDTILIPKSPRSGAMARATKTIAAGCETTHEGNARRFRRVPNTYFRLNVEQGVQGLGPQHWEKWSEVSAHTYAYLRTADTRSKLTEAVK